MIHQASERKLNPPRERASTPREKLMESIKGGRINLKPSPVNKSEFFEAISYLVLRVLLVFFAIFKFYKIITYFILISKTFIPGFGCTSFYKVIKS